MAPLLSSKKISTFALFYLSRLGNLYKETWVEGRWSVLVLVPDPAQICFFGASGFKHRQGVHMLRFFQVSGIKFTTEAGFKYP